MSKAETFKQMSQDNKLRDLVMRGMAECAYEFSKAPKEDQALIINKWTDSMYALIKTMVEHDKEELPNNSNERET